MRIAIACFDANIRIYHETLQFFSQMLWPEHEVVQLGCDGLLNRCTNFLSYGEVIDTKWLTKNKENICKRCKANQGLMPGFSKFHLSKNEDALTEEQSQIINRLKDVKALKGFELLGIYYGSAPIGRLAFFDFSMINKLTDKSQLSEAQLEDYLEHLKDCFHVWNFVERVTKSQPPDAVIYVNGNYSLNAVVRECLKRLKTKCWSIEFTWANTILEKKIYIEEDRLIHSRTWKSLEKAKKRYGSNLKDSRVAIHSFKSRIFGEDFNSYSSPLRTPEWSKFDRFKARFKEVISVFVSSADELVIHEVVYGFRQDKSFFKDQFEWLKFIVDNANPEVGYVIRLHPRLKPNKRDKVEASEYPKVIKALEAARGLNNFLIIEPDAEISSYYVLINSQLSIISWSMMAMESVILGVPTVVCFPKNMSFPAEEWGPHPASLEEIRRFLTRETIPARTDKHDIELMKWAEILYSAIGLKVPGVRYAKTFTERLYRIIQSRVLSSNLLFNLFYKWRYRKKIVVMSGGQLELVPETVTPSERQNQALKSLEELRKFREEAIAVFNDQKNKN